MPQRDIVVIGGSAGAIGSLQKLVQNLPRDFAGAILVVVHLSPDSRGLIPGILTRAGPLPASNAKSGEAIKPGHIYVAPPNRHLIIEDSGKLHVGHGPKENGFRPAIDPLFRSAALRFGPRLIGIVLSGGLDDGTAGLCTISRLGGVTIVQNPDEAESSSMPESALRHVRVDHVVTIKEMATLLPILVRETVDIPTKEAKPMPDDIKIEVEVAANERPHPGILDLGMPSIFTCPECNGSLLRIPNSTPMRFRCHTGHAFTANALEDKLHEKIEAVVWSAVKALQEHAILLEELTLQPDVSEADAAAFRNRAEDALRRAKLVRKALVRTDAEPD